MTLNQDPPTLRLLSLGAGVQSTALLILSARGDLEPIDGAIFSDTGWEPKAVYQHLDRLEREIAAPAGIPIHRVSSGNIRNDALDPAHRFASMPLFVRNQDDGDGMARRQCTSEYKLNPIKAKVRDLLGYPHPARVPVGVVAEQWIGISTDEAHRAFEDDGTTPRSSGNLFTRNRYPLLDLGLSRDLCTVINEDAGFGDTPKSACIGCPFHTNRQWRQIRDTDPEAWADAVEFDKAIRHGSARANSQGQPLRGQMFLHRTRVPLDEAPIDRVTAAEWRSRQSDLVGLLDMMDLEDKLGNATGGCSPFGCRTEGAA